jgi:predicted DsbA family dithiol-disulfide isomerase
VSTTSLLVTEYTDPGCPWAYSTEPMLWRLRWHYGEALDWRRRMIVLSRDRAEIARRGVTPERRAQIYAAFAAGQGMPFDTTPRPRIGATLPACRAVVAARLHAPEREGALLRQLRIELMATPDGVLDEPATIAAAGRAAGIDPDALERWLADPAVERALEQDVAATDAPAPAALAQRHKLQPGRDGGWRYSASSLVFSRADGAAFDVPGFQPSLAYEAAVANLAPELERRARPGSVGELLAWAGVPLATREVAEVMDVPQEQARAALESAEGVVERPAGTDAFWALDAQ